MSQLGELQVGVAPCEDVPVGEAVGEAASDTHEPGISGHVVALLQDLHLLHHLVYLAVLGGGESVLVALAGAELGEEYLLASVAGEVVAEALVAVGGVEVFVHEPPDGAGPVHVGVQGDVVHARVAVVIELAVLLDEGTQPLVQPPYFAVRELLVSEVHGGGDEP